ncbi:MAG: cation transporter [Clostridia bacterium]|nr:cation transporter [Clostridia bacterium]
MKTHRNILTAFLLNTAFSIFEIIGGILTGSAAIISDAVHDAGDAVSIGVSYFAERLSKKPPDEKYTYGYARFSALGALFTTAVLTIGSTIAIIGAVGRIVNPAEINYNGMILFALLGVVVNFLAAHFTSGEGSLNQSAVNLHMLEDLFGWIVVLVGATVMKFTDFYLIDPIMSIAVSAVVLISAVLHSKKIIELFLEKAPRETDASEIKKHIEELDGVVEVHHLHLWSLDGQTACATMHVVCDAEPSVLKKAIREELSEHGIHHVTLEFEGANENCADCVCRLEYTPEPTHAHHGHGH